MNLSKDTYGVAPLGSRFRFRNTWICVVAVVVAAAAAAAATIVPVASTAPAAAPLARTIVFVVVSTIAAVVAILCIVTLLTRPGPDSTDSEFRPSSSEFPVEILFRYNSNVPSYLTLDDVRARVDNVVQRFNDNFDFKLLALATPWYWDGTSADAVGVDPLTTLSDELRGRTILFQFEPASHDGHESFDGPGRVLAHGTVSDVRPRYICFDSNDRWFDNVEFARVFLHELGHVLGLEHTDRESVMNTSCTKLSNLSSYDVERFLELYPFLYGYRHEDRRGTDG